MTELSKTSVTKLSVKVFYDAKTRSSFCWKYFGNLLLTDNYTKRLVNVDQVYCSACLNAVKEESEDVSFGTVKIKSYNKTVSTGNLTRHLRDDHQIKVEKLSRKKAKSNKYFVPSRERKSCSAKTKPCPKHDKNALAKDMALWYCKSLLPFDSFCDEGMVEFFKKYSVIASENDMPSPFIVSGYALSELYETLLVKIKDIIAEDASLHFALTFDFWTDQCRRLDYITFSLHYLTTEFELKALTLSTEIVTAENIHDIVEDIKKRFALYDKHITAVSDAEVNVKRAVAVANMSHHQCLGHALHNLVIVDGINTVPEIATLVQKCKNIVKAVRYCSLELQAEVDKIEEQLEFLSSLDTVVEALEIDEGNPIPQQDVATHEDMKEFGEDILPSRHVPRTRMTTPTRWHIVLEILQSVIQVSNRKIINNMLNKIGQEALKLSQNDWHLLVELATFLKSFREVVQIFMSQETCTINLALVFRSEIIDVLNSFQDPLESTFISQLKRHMFLNINNRFPVTKSVVAAALLDNRFISLKEIDVFLEEYNMPRSTFLSSYVKEVVCASVELEIKLEPLATTSHHAVEGGDTSLLHKLSKKHSIISAIQEMQDDPIEQECWRYLASADPMEPKDGNLLAYWNNRKNTLPWLSALAKALLCVPATTTPSARVFSTIGLTVSARRSRLSPSRVNKIVFVHDNYETCMT